MSNTCLEEDVHFYRRFFSKKKFSVTLVSKEPLEVVFVSVVPLTMHQI